MKNKFGIRLLAAGMAALMGVAMLDVPTVSAKEILNDNQSHTEFVLVSEDEADAPESGDTGENDTNEQAGETVVFETFEEAGEQSVLCVAGYAWRDENGNFVIGQNEPGEWMNLSMPRCERGEYLVFGLWDGENFTGLNASQLKCENSALEISDTGETVEYYGAQCPIIKVAAPCVHATYEVTTEAVTGAVNIQVDYDRVNLCTTSTLTPEGLIKAEYVDFSKIKKLYILTALSQPDWKYVLSDFKLLEPGENRTEIPTESMCNYKEITDTEGDTIGYEIDFNGKWPSTASYDLFDIYVKIGAKTPYSEETIDCGDNSFMVREKEFRQDSLAVCDWLIRDIDGNIVSINPDADFYGGPINHSVMTQGDLVYNVALAYKDENKNIYPVGLSDLSYDQNRMNVKEIAQAVAHQGKEFNIFEITFKDGLGYYEVEEKNHGVVLEIGVELPFVGFYSGMSADYNNLPIRNSEFFFEETREIYALKNPADNTAEITFKSAQASYRDYEGNEIALDDAFTAEPVYTDGKQTGYKFTLPEKWPTQLADVDYYSISVDYKYTNEWYDWDIQTFIMIRKERRRFDNLFLCCNFQYDENDNITGVWENDQFDCSAWWQSPRYYSKDEGIPMIFAYADENGNRTPLGKDDFTYDPTCMRLESKGETVVYDGQTYEICYIYLLQGMGNYFITAPAYDLSIYFTLGFSEVDFFTDNTANSDNYIMSYRYAYGNTNPLYILNTFREDLWGELKMDGLEVVLFTEEDMITLPTEKFLTYTNVKKDGKVVGYKVQFKPYWPSDLKEYFAFSLRAKYQVVDPGTGQVMWESDNYMDISREIGPEVPLGNKKYTVTYKLYGGTNSVNNPATHTPEAAVKLYAPTRKGYTFKGWYTESTYKNKITSIEEGQCKNVTVYAKWAPKTYTITYKLFGGTNSARNPKTFTVEKEVKLYSPKKKGYTFMGWYTDSNYKNKITAIPKGTAKNITLYAKWKPVKYTITYKLDGGKNSSRNPKTFTIEKKVNLYNPSKQGYTFGGWYTDSRFKNKITAIPKGTAKNMTLYAKWTKK